ncbi:MAG: rod shape-determining protein [Victivallales bacterium]|nr:rod shape-determining protein [Victivallales bacterium]
MANLLNFFRNLFHNDVGIDLGTMNTLLYHRGKGVDVAEPTVVAVSSGSNEVLAVGHEAKQMLGVNPGTIYAVRPMRNGVIKDPGVTDKMLRKFLEKKANPIYTAKIRAVVAVPSVITVVESQAVVECVRRAGASEVRLVEEPLAAANGAGLPIEEPTANMIADIGGGTTEIAIISLGGIVHCNSVPVAGDAMDDAITRHMKDVHNLSIGELEAEKIKIQIGSAIPFAKMGDGCDEKTMIVRGLKLGHHGDNLPSSVTVNSEEIRNALREPIEEIAKAIQATLSAARPELAGNLVNNGITITGGGSNLPGLDLLLSERFHMIVHKDEDPMRAVIKGVGKFIEDGSIFEHPQAKLVGINV